MRARIALGTETGSDGRRIGRDPRKMGPDELRALGHAPMAPTAAIRAHCLDCCGGSSEEVRKCTAVGCPSWPFRIGANPWRAPLSEAERARRRERIARVAKGRAGSSPQLEKSRGADAASPSAAISAPAAPQRRGMNHHPEIRRGSLHRNHSRSGFSRLVTGCSSTSMRRARKICEREGIVPCFGSPRAAHPQHQRSPLIKAAVVLGT
jgi:hypothetical protein